MQNQHQHVLGDWTVPQHPHAPVGMNPSLHLWPHHISHGQRIQGSKVHPISGDPSSRPGGKNAVLQKPANLQVQAQNVEDLSAEQNENFHEPNEASKGSYDSFPGTVNGVPLGTANLQQFMFTKFGRGARDPRMQSMVPYYAPYNAAGWNPEDMVPTVGLPGALHPGRAATFDHALVPTYPGGEVHHSYMTENHHSYMTEHASLYSGMTNGVMPTSAIHPPVTDLRTLQAVLREAKPGSGQVAEALLQVAFPLRLPGLTAIMGRFTKSGQWAISLDIFDTLPALALPRDTTVCNAALAACMRGCLWQRAKQTFDLMITQGVPLDNITYYTMLSVPRRRKLWRVTMDLFLHMCQADVQPVLPDVAGMLSEISQDGKWPLTEKLFNYVFRHFPELTVPHHIESAAMKDMSASDLQIVRMLNNAMRQNNSQGIHAHGMHPNMGVRSSCTDAQGPYRVFPESSPVSHGNPHSAVVANNSNKMQQNGGSAMQACGPDCSVDDITSSMSCLSFERPSSNSDTPPASRTDSRSGPSETRPGWQDPALESLIQQAAAMAAREGTTASISPEVACCNEMISVYLRCGLPQRAGELIRRMMLVGGTFTPGIETCHRFLTFIY